MNCFDTFDPLDGNVPSYPFYGLFDIAWKARELLEGMSLQDILWIEHDIDSKIEQAREILAKAREKRKATSEDDFDDLDDEVSEVDALSFAEDIGLGTTQPEEPSFSPVRCAAVLALMHVAECVETLDCPEEDLGTSEDGPVAARLIPAANAAFYAARALGLALMYERHITVQDELEADNEESLANFNKDRARKAAQRKHGKMNAARAFVQTEWTEHSEAYERNKSAFSRDYVRRCFNEFQVTITEKQMREVWLKDTPFASKPDGMPANGR